MALCIRRTLCRVTIGTPTVIFAVWLFLTVLTILVHSWYSLGRHVTTGMPMVIFAVPTVYQSSKTVKRQSKQQKMTIGVPIVTCLHRVRRIHKATEMTQNPCWTGTVLFSKSLAVSVAASKRLQLNENDCTITLLCPWGGNERCFCPSVCPSVCPFVAYIANNSRAKIRNEGSPP